MNLTIPLILSKLLDLSVTEYGINSGHLKELNITNRAPRLIINSTFLVASPLIYKEIHKKNKKLANVTAALIIIGNSYLVMHNLREMRK